MKFLSFVCVISEKLLTVLSIHTEYVYVCKRPGKSFVSLYNSTYLNSAHNSFYRICRSFPFDIHQFAIFNFTNASASQTYRSSSQLQYLQALVRAHNNITNFTYREEILDYMEFDGIFAKFIRG